MIALIIAGVLALAIPTGFITIVVSIHRKDRAMSASVRAQMVRGVQWT